MAVGMMGPNMPAYGGYGYNQLAMFQMPANGNVGYNPYNPYSENVNLSPRGRMEALYDQSYQNWNSLSYGNPTDWNRIQQQNFGAYAQTPNFTQSGQDLMYASQQFNEALAPMQQAEGDMMNTSVQQFGQQKDEIFKSYHYEFGENGPHLVRGEENAQNRAQRLQWERRQAMAVERQWSNHPLNGRVRQLQAEVDRALQSGQNPTQLLLALDAAKTELSVEKTRALMMAQSPHPDPNSPRGANDAATALLDFGNQALNDYVSFHGQNMLQLAQDPRTQAYLNALAQQRRAMSGYLGTLR